MTSPTRKTFSLDRSNRHGAQAAVRYSGPRRPVKAPASRIDELLPDRSAPGAPVRTERRVSNGGGELQIAISFSGLGVLMGCDGKSDDGGVSLQSPEARRRAGTNGVTAAGLDRGPAGTTSRDMPRGSRILTGEDSEDGDLDHGGRG
jgi:hypothetical protein